jgi:hypothetical protein
LTQDIPMIPFVYGFQNWVLDEVCFVFFNFLESHGLWKICLLSIISILDAWHARCWLWTYNPPGELKIHASERLLTRWWQKQKLYKKKDIVMNLQKLVLWRMTCYLLCYSLFSESFTINIFIILNCLVMIL